MTERTDRSYIDPARPRRGARLALLLAAVILAVLVVQAVRHQRRQDRIADRAIAWQSDYERAARKARDSDKPLLVVITSETCPPCQVMRRQVYPQDRVADLINARFVPLKVDVTSPGDEERAVTRRFRARFTPTVIVLHPMGRELDRRHAMNADQLLDMLEQALEDASS